MPAIRRTPPTVSKRNADAQASNRVATTAPAGDGFGTAAVRYKELNPSAALPPQTYGFAAARTVENYQKALRVDEKPLGPGDKILDCGAGWAVAAIQLALKSGARAIAINTQDFLGDFLAETTNHGHGSLWYSMALGDPHKPAEERDVGDVQRRLRSLQSEGKIQYEVGFVEERIGAHRGEISLLTDYFGAASYSPARAELFPMYFDALGPGGEARVFLDFSTKTWVETASGRQDLLEWMAKRYPENVSVTNVETGGEPGRLLVLKKTRADQTLPLPLERVGEELTGLFPVVSYRER